MEVLIKGQRFKLVFNPERGLYEWKKIEAIASPVPDFRFAPKPWRPGATD